MNWRWIFLMAWRDSRKNRSRLFLFISSIILGIASLVSMNSFNRNLKKDIDLQAAELIGADLALETNRKPTAATLAFIDSLSKLSLNFAKEERFMSMLRFPKADASRFVQVRALEGSFPFYGAVETKPAGAFGKFNQEQGIYIENPLLLQYSLQLGDTLQLGTKNFPLLGGITAQPGQSAIAGAMAPSLFIPLAQLQGAGLQQTGSRIEYHYYFKLPADFQVDKKIKSWKDKLSTLQLRASTIQTTKENTGRSFSDMANFMELVGFVALLLGCIGVSSAVQIYVREKLMSVAILRCLGTSAKQAFFIFVIQFAAIGLLGGIVGAALGTVIQFAIPYVMQDVLPVALTTQIVWPAIFQGILLGLVIAVLFALLPLLSVRHISPLNSLRLQEEPEGLLKDKLKIWVYLLIILFIVLFARTQMDTWLQTLLFSLGIGFTFLLLYGVARGFTWLIRKYFPSNWSYLWRQGLSNLWRPNNQTVILIVSIGLGTTLIATLYFVQDMLLNRVAISAQQNEANMLMFDIQPSQREGISQLAQKSGYPIVESVPIVTMFMEAVNGTSLQDVLKDTTSEISGRAFRGEIRATYRDSLSASEKVSAGKWVGQVSPTDTASVSLDENYAEGIGVKVGDVLTMNVQGLRLPAKVSSLRKVDWNRFQSNFRMVFAKGSIDQAPQFYLMMTKVTGEEQAMRFQQEVVNSYPNVSIIDMNAVLSILNTILEKIGFIIKFIGGFSILTGIVVLISSVRISKYQRIKENVLLRTLGASSKQIYLITISEYMFLGLLAALCGLFIALVASSMLAIFVFESAFVPPLGFVLFILTAVPAMTVFIGLINSLAVLNKSPLAVLRNN